MTHPMKKSSAPSHQFDSTILREYDIRGIIGETLSEVDAYFIGRSFASFVVQETGIANPTICLGFDGRISSVPLQKQVAQGLQDCGAQVVRVGLGPTPMLYYAVASRKAHGGVMVTGSHNPPSHNGFKFMLGTKAFYGQDIQKLGSIAAEGKFSEGAGSLSEQDIREEYITALLSAYDGKRPLKVAWDAGNGAAGEIMQQVCARLPGTHHTLFAEIDGTFPNHHPDPTVAKNLIDLIHCVKTNGCDLGVAFDGDGDRVGVVDGEGNILWGDQLMVILARDVLRELPGSTIIAAVKASKVLFDAIAEAGGIPLMWKTGHSLVKTKMKETGAPLAGEMSGHIFFADKYFGFDDGLYAAIRLIGIIARSNETLAQMREKLPHTYSTPELRFPCDDRRKFLVIDEVKARLADAKATYSDIDGVRVNTNDGWWLLRASNTQAVLVARAEASSPQALESLKHDLRTQLGASGLELPEESVGH